MISGTIICGNSMMPLVRGGKIFGIYTSVSRALTTLGRLAALTFPISNIIYGQSLSVQR